ncbi:MAG TPA: sigma-70 family RNA polymerase sigma factor [Vicinamibacteria bacterium]
MPGLADSPNILATTPRGTATRREACLHFETTSWSLILQASTGSSTDARQAWARLFETYWPPVYAFIRWKGRSGPDAEDLTQAYFTRFFEKDYLSDFRPEAGRFRTFLLASVTHFLANEWDRERAKKRGGGRVPVSLDTAATEDRLRFEPVDRLTPEAIFERQWVAAVLARCLEILRDEQTGPEARQRFERLKAFLVGDGPSAGYAVPARELGLSENATRVAVHRLRKRFCAVLREEVGHTVKDPAEVDAEIRFMLDVVRGGA